MKNKFFPPGFKPPGIPDFSPPPKTKIIVHEFHYQEGEFNMNFRVSEFPDNFTQSVEHADRMIEYLQTALEDIRHYKEELMFKKRSN